MPTQSDFPPKWSCDSDDKEVIVEVRDPGGGEVERDLFVRVARQLDGDAFVAVEDVTRETVPTLSEIAVIIETFDGETLWTLTLDDFTFNEETGEYETVVDADNLDVPDDEVLRGRTNGASAYSWIEIPTTDVELWMEKGDAAAIQKTAKVKYPTEWGETPPGGAHNSPRQLIENFNPDDSKPFMFGRVRSKDENDNFVTQHLGWIGGVGSASGNNVSKLWIYDFAEFFTGVPAGATFNNPSVNTVAEKILGIIRDKTVAPVAEVDIISPETEEEFAQLSEGSINSAEIKGASSDLPSDTAYYTFSDTFQDFIGTKGGTLPGEDEKITARDIDLASITFGTQGKDLLIPDPVDSRSFTANHDTLLDILTWLEKKIQANVHFEPLPGGRAVRLVVDIVPSRRTFADRAVISKKEEEGDSIDFHEPTRIIRNTALYEMKPTNTLHLRGEYPKGIVDDVWDGVNSALDILPGNDGPPPEKYPVVKAKVPALVEAANGVEVSGEVVESDAKSLEDAENEAIQRLSDQLGETSEGEIVMYGQPRLMPYDKVVAFEVCNEQVQYEQQPIEYEVQSVKHEISSDDIYKTRLTVSIWANDTNIEVESHMEEVEQ